MLRWRVSNHRVRTPCQDKVPYRASPWPANAGGAGYSYQQRQCLPRSPQRMDAALPRRRHEEPAELSELAPNDRKAGRRVDPGSLDHGSRRNGALPTDFAIKAKENAHDPDQNGDLHAGAPL